MTDPVPGAFPPRIDGSNAGIPQTRLNGMKTRGTILLTLTVLGFSLVLLVSPAAPAWACSCAPNGQDERADLIVIGTVTEVTDTGIRLAVESTEKGNLG
ncbi:hypothetical protein GCM10010439_34760 [Actinocorallia aurantiaca]|uniref:Uncharacterized protein n=2 Tax=Actinocorallia aurantiaca TaxID=46204 RepID=A0ABN3U9W6_9ACTN